LQQEFQAIYKSFFTGGDPERFAAQVFETFDVDHDGYVNFTEFMWCVQLTLTTKQIEMRFVFAVIVIISTHARTA
jgi:Ca2+-binding EF-hand superfamily protein